MNISEVAKLVGLSSKQIRDYEKSGLLKPAQRSLSGYRHYEEKDLERLRFIVTLEMLGFHSNKFTNFCNYRIIPIVVAEKLKHLRRSILKH